MIGGGTQAREGNHITRETKIGLLVGLAFIIVIGILLSDHLTSSTEPPQAALGNAGNNVRQTVVNPGQPGPQLPSVTPGNATPNAPVPTVSELTPGPNPVSIVKVGPGQTNDPSHQPPQSNQPSVAVNPPTDNTSPVITNEPPVTMNSSKVPTTADRPTFTRLPAPNTNPNGIETVAAQHGEELVDQNGRAIRSTPEMRPTGAVVEYKCEPGDSLSKIALKVMGSASKSNRDAIVALNPSLKDDPNKVIVGKVYLVPTSAANVPSNTTAGATPMPAPASPPATPTAATIQPQTGEFWYTVKPGDSLWKIANEQCGKPGAVAAIKELNKDVLKGAEHDVVIVGTRLRLPTKPVEQAKAN